VEENFAPKARAEGQKNANGPRDDPGPFVIAAVGLEPTTRGLWMHRRKERTGDCTRGTSLCRSFPALAGSISSVVTLCPDVTTTPIMD